MSKEQESMEQLAQVLYRRHQKVLDFIWEHGSSSRFSIARETALGSEWGGDRVVPSPAGDLISLSSGNDWFSFLPASWFESLGGRDFKWPGCENWWWSGFPVICSVILQQSDNAVNGAVLLRAEVGPLSDHAARYELIKRIESAGNDAAPTLIGFRRGAASEGTRFSRFTKNNKVPIEDVSNHEELAAAINELLRNFGPALDAIAPIFDKIETGWVEVVSE